MGTITEFALILNIKYLIEITQSLEFWGIIMILSSIISKEYKYAIINSSFLMLSMNSSYYIIRLIKSGYTNLGNWDMYNFICIGGVVFIATLIFVIKDVISKKKNYFRIFNLAVMTILGILFLKFKISLGFRFWNLMQYVSLGIMVAYVLTLLSKLLYNKLNEFLRHKL